MQRKLSAWRFVVGAALVAASVSAISLLPASAEDPIATPDAERIATGGTHACAVTKTGGVKCWGQSSLGQLGNGETRVFERPVPVDVVGLTSGVAAVSAGSSHSCALSLIGGVSCWGSNYSSQLGNGSDTNSSVPVDVVGLTSGVAAISAGSSHSCALLSTGGVACWGFNHRGQLGDGSQADSSVPVDVVGLATAAVAVSVGQSHTCALLSTGAVACWGSNTGGQLGDGSQADSSVPVDVIGLVSGVVGVSAGGEHSCALSSTGGVQCWGRNFSGQLGDGSNDGSSVPVDVVGLTSGVAAISAGSSHSCALLSTGGVTCWGADYDGQLGDLSGSKTSSSIPVEVFGLESGVLAITAGGNAACALLTAGEAVCWPEGRVDRPPSTSFTSQPHPPIGQPSSVPVDVVPVPSGLTAVTSGALHVCGLAASGSLWCWGDDLFGQLGGGQRGQEAVREPVNVASGVAEVAAGLLHSCALTTAGGAKCWGWNLSGQLGTPGGYETFGSFRDVPGLTTGVLAVAAGDYHSCAVTSTGGVTCWGDNERGQLGDGSTSEWPEWSPPVEVVGLGAEAVAISTGGSNSCALLSTGAVQCWGAGDGGRLGNASAEDSPVPVGVVGLTSGVTAISSGQSHSCAVTSTGGVQCWGSNSSGQLGDGTTAGSSVPVEVNGLASAVIAISASGSHTCAVLSTGGVQCWGANGSGQLGDGSMADSFAPTEVVGLSSGVISISVGSDSSCAVTSAGGAQCWGANDRGQLGDGFSRTGFDSRFLWDGPADLTYDVATGVQAIAAGGNHSCGLTSSNGVRCWGSNGSGQLGNGTTRDSCYLNEEFGCSEGTSDVTGLTAGVAAIAAGGEHSCALRSNGGVLCWGKNGSGQLGDGSTADSVVPVGVVGLSSGVVAIAAGWNDSCALLATGAVQCWGNNASGQLGDGSKTNSSVPVGVAGLSSAATAISAGSNHSCALLSTGGVQCWGNNGSGQLGNGAGTNSSTPVDVTGLAEGVASISAGGNHTCALLDTSGVKCWGNNGNGQLGNGSTTGASVAVKVSGLPSGASAISVRADRSCAALLSGGVACWGSNAFGALGDGSTNDSLVPVRVVGLRSDIAAVATGWNHSCALTVAGRVQCWGNNGNGRLGNATVTDSWVPVDVTGPMFSLESTSAVVTAFGQPAESLPEVSFPDFPSIDRPARVFEPAVRLSIPGR